MGDFGGGKNSRSSQRASLRRSFNQVPEFERLTNSDGRLRSQFSVANAGAGQIQRAGNAVDRLEGLTDFGTATPIAQRLLQVQNTANTQAVNNLAAQQAGQLAQGVGALARQGGISSGARERLASNAFNQGLLAQQRQDAADQAARQQISADDASRQLNILGQLPGQRQNIANFERAGRQADITTAIQDVRAANQDDVQRQASLAQSLAAVDQAPKGGLGGVVGGVLGK